MSIKKMVKEITSEIRKNDVIYVTAHKNLDLDAVGAMIGVYILAKHYKKKAYLVIEDKKHEESVKKAIDKLGRGIPYKKTKEINTFGKKNLLIIVDTNKPYLLQNEDLLTLFNNILIIDHHEKSKDTIQTNNNYIIEGVSSTCEIISNILQTRKIKLKENYATIILSGIFLDTNNFTLNTSSSTYQAAYYLTNNNASNKEVQYLLKQDLKKYIDRQKMLYDIDIVSKKIAMTKGNKKEKLRREDLAKVADTLLQFNKIEASIAVGMLGENKVGISARSIGNIDVNKLLKKYNGGGTNIAAAAIIETKDINATYKEIKQYINSL